MRRGIVCRALHASAVCAATVAVAANASAAPSAPAPMPALETLAIDEADVGTGGKLVASKSSQLGGRPVLIRILKGQAAGRPFVVVVLAMVEQDADAAYSDFAELRTELGLSGVRKNLANFVGPGFEWGKQLFGGDKLKNIKLEKAVVGRRIAMGTTAFRVPLTVRLNVGTLKYDVGVVYADRAFATVEVLGFGGKRAPAATTTALVSAEQHLLQRTFTVANRAPPSIGGTAGVGQRLTVNEGRWSGTPTKFAYSWSRCDAGGNACVPIEGATAKTYVPTPGDSGATLRAEVTGSNAVSSAQAASAASALIA